ncbi:MAG: ribosome silencing factor [Aestuariivita sp.]|nr:ribosome silencing factor [Aestuariivita sp.]
MQERKTQAHSTSDLLLEAIFAQLSDDKAEDIVIIDLSDKSSFGDYMIVCSGRSTRQVAALSDKVIQKVKSDFGIICRVEGKKAADWVLIDTGDIIVHIFRPEVREFYQLEKMWLVPATSIT